MINLGEQWVEEIDGKEHLVKLVESHINDTKRCGSCMFYNQSKNLCTLPKGVKHISEIGCLRRFLIIKDLGILNDDGCLPSSFGEYPTVATPSEDNGEWCVYAFLNEGKKLIKDEEAWGNTKQEAIDVWNRRV